MKKNYIDILNNTLAKHDSATNRKSLDVSFLKKTDEYARAKDGQEKINQIFGDLLISKSPSEKVHLGDDVKPTHLILRAKVATETVESEAEYTEIDFLVDSGSDLPLILSKTAMKSLKGTPMVVDELDLKGVNKCAERCDRILVHLKLGKMVYLVRAVISENMDSEAIIGNWLFKFYNITIKDGEFSLSPRNKDIDNLIGG